MESGDELGELHHPDIDLWDQPSDELVALAAGWQRQRAQEPEPLAHAPPETLELVAESA